MMDANFVFPRPQPAVPRPHKPSATMTTSTKPSQTLSRESTALRASVLDAALELGIGTNPLVADWMFNNALKEEDEEEDQMSSPSLTFGSSATSEESAFSMLTPSSSTHSSSSPVLGGGGAGVATKFGQLRSDGIVQILDSNGINSSYATFQSADGDTNLSKNPNTVLFPQSETPIPIPPRPTTPRKLKKKIKGDGYESEGGYVSESGAKKKEKERRKAELKEKEKEKAREKAELKAKEKEKVALVNGQEAGDGERKRKKSLLSAVKSSKSSKDKDKDAEAMRGYETDGGDPSSKSKSMFKKSKAKSAKALSPGDVGYETDAGYQSSSSVKKSKSRFFKLGGSKDKDSSGAGSADMEPPPVPMLPADILKDAVSLPIADRFATAFGAAASVAEVPSSKVGSPTLATSTPPLRPPSSGSGAPVPSAAAFSSIRLAAASADRSSQASTESSTSSSYSARRRAAQFSPAPSSSHGLNDSGASYATLTSSQAHRQPHLNSQQQRQAQLSASRPTSPSGSIGGAMIPSPSFSIPISQSQDGHHGPTLSSNMKPSYSHPPISYPLSRFPSSPTATASPFDDNVNDAASSPVSPVSPSAVPLPTTPVTVAPLQINKDKEKGGLRLKPSLEKLGLPGFRSRGTSPAPVSPISPGASAPAAGGRPQVQVQAQPQSTGSNSTHSPRSFISAPNTAATNSSSLSPSGLGFDKLQQQQQRPAQLSLAPPSDNVSFPSRAPSPSRPNVLAYYDIPPPSPPPMGPLPTLPGPSSNGIKANSTAQPIQSSNLSSAPFPPASILRQRVIDRTPRPVPPDAVPYQHVAALQNIQRGKESPFPARPVLPPGTVPRRYGTPMTYQQGKESNSKDLKRARFASGEPTNIESKWIDNDSEDAYSYLEDENGEVVGYEQEEEESQEIRDVLDRFDDDGRRSEDDSHASHSFEALKTLVASENQNGAVADNHVIDPPTEPYAFARPPKPEMPGDIEEGDYDGATIGNRSSRWSGSIYSRYSILDEDESGLGRETLVKRVEEMLSKKDGERERIRAFGGDSGVIPPVPRLPAAYANMNSNTGTTSAERSSSAQETVVTSPVGRSWNRF